jgi:hypothetical protein
MNECTKNITMWSLFSVLITFMILYVVYFLYMAIRKQQIIASFNEQFNTYCKNLEPITYKNKVYVPQKNGVYEKNLSLALLDISINTSNSNCLNVLPLPNPPGFTEQYRVEGINPINGNLTMYAYIFWDVKLKHAVISFTGTTSVAEWESDFQYQQVPPNMLNGYEDGILVHKGFYNIYLSIRNQLWNWWEENKLWVKNLYITGHSLGGALSTLCGFDFAGVFINNINDKEIKKDKEIVKHRSNLPNKIITTLQSVNFNFDNSISGLSRTNRKQRKNEFFQNQKNIKELRKKISKQKNIKNTDFVPLLEGNIIHYSFASPRVGNTKYAEKFNKRLPYSLRINNTEDIIPALPPAAWDGYIFEHTGGSIAFTKSLDSLSEDHTEAYFDYMPPTN